MNDVQIHIVQMMRLILGMETCIFFLGLNAKSHDLLKLDIMRQVQIIAGVLVLLGVILSPTVAPAFMYLSGMVGAGLLLQVCPATVA